MFPPGSFFFMMYEVRSSPQSVRPETEVSVRCSLTREM